MTSTVEKWLKQSEKYKKKKISETAVYKNLHQNNGKTKKVGNLERRISQYRTVNKPFKNRESQSSLRYVKTTSERIGEIRKVGTFEHRIGQYHGQMLEKSEKSKLLPSGVKSSIKIS